MKKFLYIALVLLLTACGKAATTDDSIIEATMAIDIDVTAETETTKVITTTEAPTTSVPETTIAESSDSETTTKVPSTTDAPESTVATTAAETATTSPETTAPETTTQEATLATTTKAPMTTIAATTTKANEGQKEFTKKDLGAFTGLDGMPAYFAYKGIVYDVSQVGDWAGGEHFGNYAGYDLTDDLAYASHGEEKLKKAKIVGVLVD